MTLPTRDELVAEMHSAALDGEIACVAVERLLKRWPAMIREPEREEGWWAVDAESHGVVARHWHESKWYQTPNGTTPEHFQGWRAIGRLHESPAPAADRRITREEARARLRRETGFSSEEISSVLAVFAAADAFKESSDG